VPLPIRTIDALNDAGFRCGLCQDVIADKMDPRYGLLSCEHVFCLQCIRSWRNSLSIYHGGANNSSSGNTHPNNNDERSCPQCRDVTYFVTPSTEWPADADRKQRIISEYKRNLGKIPCGHFRQGQGVCPFGSSCFYEHRLPDGRLVDASTSALGNSALPGRPTVVLDANEQRQPMRDCKLSDFVQHSLAKQLASASLANKKSK
jgi:E3 ubiquitin-protein ligase makorin